MMCLCLVYEVAFWRTKNLWFNLPQPALNATLMLGARPTMLMTSYHTRDFVEEKEQMSDQTALYTYVRRAG